MVNKLILTVLLLSSYAIHAQDVSGNYLSYSNELLTLREDGTFRRITNSKVVTGTYEVKNNYIEVTKQKESYNLYFVVGLTSLVIIKPNSRQAWIFERIN